MSITRIGVVVSVIAATMVAAGFVYVSQRSPHPDPAAYSQVVTAARAYRAQLTEQGRVLPSSITLQDLCVRGLLASHDLETWKDLNVTISLRNDDRVPEGEIVSVQFPDGIRVVALQDGSIQYKK